MTEKQIGGNGMAKRQPTVLRVPENGAGDPFFGRQGNWFEVIFESSYDGFYITDGNAITLTLNKSYETISGLRKEEMVGRSMAELVASRVISASGTLLALERRESVTMEQQFKTGKRAIITSTPVFDSESNIVMVVTNVRDVTELYSLKEQLEQSEERNRLYSAELEAAHSRQDRNPSSLIFHDKNMQNVISLLNRAAQMEVPVLLQGEVGVGKGALSEYIYSKSKRRKEHFITIPCASLPDDTMVAELFGLGPGVSPEYPQGKTGLLEQANRGVVFLDEVEQLNHESQTRLLSAIKRRQVKPLGYGADKPCDLRIIASTSADLLALVREKKFREDLYYALSVLPINVPPLRERREDIIPLINHFLMVENQKYHTNKSIYSDTIDAFEGYCWPGNVRELKNTIEKMVILSDEDIISSAELWSSESSLIKDNVQLGNIQLKTILEQIELKYIREYCSLYGTLEKTAEKRGISRTGRRTSRSESLRRRVCRRAGLVVYDGDAAVFLSETDGFRRANRGSFFHSGQQLRQLFCRFC